jgi:hypothetical protein
MLRDRELRKEIRDLKRLLADKTPDRPDEDNDSGRSDKKGKEKAVD